MSQLVGFQDSEVGLYFFWHFATDDLDPLQEPVGSGPSLKRHRSTNHIVVLSDYWNILRTLKSCF